MNDQFLFTGNPERGNKDLLKLILLAGLLVGTTDILAAFLNFYITSGKNPFPVVLKFIASGIYGKAAFKAGTGMMLAGLLFHYMIAFTFTASIFYLYRKLPVVSLHWVLKGIGWGIMIWGIMNLIVLPLSNAPKMKPGIEKSIVAALILITMMGLPLAYIAKRNLQRERTGLTKQ